MMPRDADDDDQNDHNREKERERKKERKERERESERENACSILLQPRDYLAHVLLECQGKQKE